MIENYPYPNILVGNGKLTKENLEKIHAVLGSVGEAPSNQPPKCPYCGEDTVYQLVDPSGGEWDWFCMPCFGKVVNKATDGDWTNLTN